MRFGEKVRDLRKKHSLTQDELAKCLGVSKRTVIGWERDGRYPRNVEILEKMADIFHVPLTYINVVFTFFAFSSRILAYNATENICKYDKLNLFPNSKLPLSCPITPVEKPCTSAIKQ